MVATCTLCARLQACLLNFEAETKKRRETLQAYCLTLGFAPLTVGNGGREVPLLKGHRHECPWQPQGDLWEDNDQQ